MANIFSYIVTQIIIIENAMTSVQGVEKYIRLLSEVPALLSGDKELIQADWPTHANIVLKNFTMRYRPEFEPVLKILSFTVKAGMKVGVMGRTGAGKSSPLQGLLRLVEREEGVIEIDG